jgi:hypothetical protein
MKFCFQLLLCIYLIGCTNQKSELKEIRVNSKMLGDFNLSEITDSVIAIPLETNDNCLLSFVRKVKFSKDFIYIADTKSLYRFDKKGKFINQVIKTGRGPGEIIAFYDYYIEQNSDIIDVLSFKKIVRLHSDGQIIQEYPLTGFPEQIQMIDSSFMVNTCDFGIPYDEGKHNVSKMVRFNKEFIPEDTLIILDIANVAASADPTAVFYSHSNNNTYFYYPSLLIDPLTHDTLFIFDKNVLIPAYKLRFEEQLYELNRTQKFDREKPPFKKFRINSIFVSSSFLFSSYSVESSDYFFCYDNKKDKSYNMLKGFIDDTYNTGNIQLKQFNFVTEKMFFVKDGIEAVGKVSGVEENSNPVIFIVYLKD